MTFDLVQPAMGVGKDGTSDKAFPPGALVIQASGEVDGSPFFVQGPILVPVFYMAGEG